MAVTAVVLAACLAPAAAYAQAVIGPIGQPGSVEMQKAAGEALRVPLPGEPAIDFELVAVVGDKIKPIKLSDYQGKYRVLIFYPADFTFV